MNSCFNIVQRGIWTWAYRGLITTWICTSVLDHSATILWIHLYVETLILVGTTCLVTGWGVSNITMVKKAIRVPHYKNKLQVLSLNIVERGECEKAFKEYKKKVGQDNLCVGSKALNKSPCTVIWIMNQDVIVILQGKAWLTNWTI